MAAGMAAGMAGAPLFEASGLSKSYAGPVLSGVDFDLRGGEVHALVGENGAGKSTLSRIIAGLVPPDAGAMRLAGEGYRPASKAEAEARGVRIVMQELKLISSLSIAENLFLDRLPRRFGFIDQRRLHDDARRVMEMVGLGGLDPGRRLGTLGVGQQQLVEIGAGLSRDGRLLILDEPTAALTAAERALLFAQIEQLKRRGVGMIYISHRLEEVERLADRITVLRDGRVVWTRKASEVSVEAIIQAMVGRALDEKAPREARPVRGEPALRVEGLCRGDLVRDISFTVHRGEILGFAGLMGSGRTETMRAIFGADPPERGHVYVGSAAAPARIRHPRDAVKLGIAMLTEDRKAEGLLLPLPIRENVSITRLRDLARGGAWIERGREEQVAARFTQALAVRCASVEQSARELSGGNQQKVVLAKWLYRAPDVLIVDEPTRGVDVASKREIYDQLAELSARGLALLVVSSDLRELYQVCDRIAVMSRGRLVALFARGEWSDEKIMTAALSGHASPRPQPPGALT